MRAKFILEEITFNFDKPAPYKRYISTKGVSRPSIHNPRKTGSGGGLAQHEEQIIEKHRLRIQELNDEIQNYEYQIQDLQDEIESLEPERIDSGELEEFYAEVQEKYGFNALDILNSGMSDEEKIRSIDALTPADDFGTREFQNLMHSYKYYHPEDPDPDKIEKIERRIKAIENVIKEREGMADRLETKIYNLENY
jgi:predicted RNase H-like nuclease (RuvC/YqgF family)